ncbi:MAG: hypothetical protein FWC55_09680 [Firmicutes bacterium]|nr:hypothetical protein [Bacillota bacterium]
MAKNIAVVDDRRNDYGATYPKRAKSLVKQGRARFLNEHTICLARPPGHLEEFYMNNTAAAAPDAPKDNGPRPGREPVIPKEAERENAHAGEERITPAGILARMDRIIGDTAYIRESLDALKSMDTDTPGHIGDGSIYNGDGGAKAEAIAAVVQSREATNQQVLRMLEKFYDNLMRQERLPVKDKFRWIQEILENLDTSMPQQIADALAESLADMLKNA